MKRTLFILSNILVIISCNQGDKVTNEHRSLNYDTNSIVIFKWDTTHFSFPNNSDPLPLSQEDIDISDSLINVAVNNYNKDQMAHSKELYNAFNTHDSTIFLIDLKDYKRQYLPYHDVNGQDIIFINFFVIKDSLGNHRVNHQEDGKNT